MKNFSRNRRLLKNPGIIELCHDVTLSPSDIIYPLFICENGENVYTNMGSIMRIPFDSVQKEVKLLYSRGIKSILLFPYIKNDTKCPNGLEAINKNNLICRSIKAIKDTCPEMNIITDIALDPYTTHGHDGVLSQCLKAIDNDKTLEILRKQALIQAEAGSDFVSPSDMMDGRVVSIRNELDKNGYNYTGIISYSAKYASSLYSPFRDCIGSVITAGPKDKSSYQLDFRNSTSGLKSAIEDASQGADCVIVKPAGFCLDIIQNLYNSLNIPIFGYQVSGEYNMIYKGFDESQRLKVALESLLAIKRSGARGIISYFGKEIVDFL